MSAGSSLDDHLASVEKDSFFEAIIIIKSLCLKFCISFLCTIVEVRPIINSAVLSSSESPTDDNLTVTVNSWSDLYLFDACRAMKSDLSRFFLKYITVLLKSPLKISLTKLLNANKKNVCPFFVVKRGN